MFLNISNAEQSINILLNLLDKQNHIRQKNNSDSSDRTDHINRPWQNLVRPVHENVKTKKILFANKTEPLKITIALIFIFSMKKHAFEKRYQVYRGNVCQIYTQTDKK